MTSAFVNIVVYYEILKSIWYSIYYKGLIEVLGILILMCPSLLCNMRKVSSG